MRTGRVVKNKIGGVVDAKIFTGAKTSIYTVFREKLLLMPLSSVSSIDHVQRDKRKPVPCYNGYVFVTKSAVIFSLNR